MNVDEYLTRLQYTGRRDVSKETLFALQEAHLRTIAYENLDIHLGVVVGLELSNSYNKIILQNRGGWCFELNGLLAWLLTELGFKLELRGAVVVPEETKPKTLANFAKAITPESRTHVVLIVEVDGEQSLTDVGFGPACIHPLALKTGDYNQNGFNYALHNIGKFWFFENHKGLGGHFYFDEQPFELADFADNCTMLQTSPESHFVKTTVTYIFSEGNILSLKGRSFRTIMPEGHKDKIIDSKEEYSEVLKQHFFLDIEAIDTLWKNVESLALG